MYEVGVPIKCATKTGYQLAQVGDSIDLRYATVNSRRGRVGKQIAHTLTTGCRQGTLNFIDLPPNEGHSGQGRKKDNVFSGIIRRQISIITP